MRVIGGRGLPLLEDIELCHLPELPVQMAMQLCMTMV